MAIELATAYVSISTSAKGLRKEIDKELGAAGAEAGKKAGGGFGDSLKKWGKRGAIVAGGAVAAGLGVALTKGLGRLTAIENAQAKMRGLGHDTKTVDAIMKNALASVKGTAFGLGEAATTAAGAVAAGIKPGKDLEGVLKSVANSAAAAGVGMDEMGGIYNKVASLGKAQNDSLQQVADKGIPIYQALAEQMGVTSEEIFKMASEGKISFEDFEKAMTSASGTVAEEMGKTFTGSLQNAWAAVGRLGASLLGGVFDKLGPAVQDVTGWIDKMGPTAERVGEAIGTAVSWASEKVGDFVAQFQAGEGAGGRFRDILTAIKDAVMVAFNFVNDTAIPAIQGFIAEFKNGEGQGGKLRDILDRLWGVLQSVAGVVTDTLIPVLKDLWDMFKKNVLPILQDVVDFVVNRLLPDVVSALETHILPAFQAVGDTVKRVWEDYVSPALSALLGFIKDHLLPLILDLYENGVKPTFKLIGDAISWAWKNVIEPALFGILDGAKATFGWIKDTGWPWLRDALQKMGDKATTFKDNAVAAFDKLKSGISAAWDGVKLVFDRFKDGLDSLKSKFSAAKDGIAQIWSTIGAAIAKPINKVIDSINNFTRNFAEKMSQIPGVAISIGTIPHVPVPAAAPQGGYAGGWRPGYADGGRVAGYSPHARADNIPAMLTAGEYVLPVRATQRLAGRFGPAFLEDLRRGLPGYADGGLVGGTLGDALSGVGSWLMDLFVNPTKALRGIADKFLGGVTESWAGKAAVGVVHSSIDKVVAWVKENVFGGASGPGAISGPVGPAIGWRGIVGIVKALFPDALITSTVRNSTVAGYGGKSLHSLGRAVDFVLNPWSRMVGATRMLSSMMRWTELIHTPAGMWQQNRGRNTADFLPITKANHFNHVHAAMADGGLVKPFVADAGVRLAPGLNLLDNRTGGPEPLGRLDRPLDLSDDSIERLADAMASRPIWGSRREFAGAVAGTRDYRDRRGY